MKSRLGNSQDCFFARIIILIWTIGVIVQLIRVEVGMSWLLSSREMIFRKGLDLSVLTERRVLAPYGLAGGSPGMRGKNTLVSPL